MINVVIPMAGLSSRFKKNGFTLPKYMLYLKDRSLFYHVIKGFENLFDSAHFIFIARDLYDTKRFIDEECTLLKLIDYSVVLLSETTSGQAETVFKGIINLDPNDSMLVFNIDSIRRALPIPEWSDSVDGYLEVFRGCGDNWSYARTLDGLPESLVVETAEKKQISDFCSTGLYFFTKVSDFRDAYLKSVVDDSLKEKYVAPLYNYMIKEGKKIRINLIERSDIRFCGVPTEYYGCLYDTISDNLI